MLASAVLAAAAIAAGPVPLLDVPTGQDAAIAGDRVVVAHAGVRGSLAVDTVGVEGRELRRILTVRMPGRRWTPRARVAASPDRVAVIVFYEQFREHGDNRYQYRLYTGPPGGPLHLAIKRRDHGWVPYDAAVDGDRVLVAEVNLKTFASRARLFVPGAAPRRLPYRLDAVALAGDHVGFTTFRGRLVVENLVSGAREIDVRTGSSLADLDLTADGRAVAGEGDNLVLAEPGGRPRQFGAGLSAPVWAGSMIAAREFTDSGTDRPVVLAPGANVSRPIGVETGQMIGPDADDRGVTWIGNGCLYYAPLDAAAPTEPPAGPCPRAEADFEEADQTLHGRTLRVRVSCVAAPAPGCTGTVVLRRNGIAGRRRYTVPAGGEGVVAVRLSRAAARSVRRAVRRHGGAALKLRGWVHDGRPPEGGRLFVVASS